MAGSSAIGKRRELLMLALALAGGAAWAPGRARAARAAGGEDIAFDAASFEAALAALGGVAADPGEIVMTLPEHVDNGAIVPVTVESFLPRTSDIYVVVEANPNPLAVRFTVPAGTDAFVATRVKVAESCRVHAVVRAQGRLYAASKPTRVTQGGCG